MRKLSCICMVVLFAFALSACDDNEGGVGSEAGDVIGPEEGR